MPSGEYQPHTDKPVHLWTEEDFVAWTVTVLRRDGEDEALAPRIIDRVLTTLMEERGVTREEALQIHKSRIEVWQGKNTMLDGRHR